MNAVAGRQEAVRQVLVGGIYIWDRVFLQSACFTAVLPQARVTHVALKRHEGCAVSPFFMPICLEPNVIFFFFLENNQTNKSPQTGMVVPLPDTSTMSPGTISLALIICTLFLSER